MTTVEAAKIANCHRSTISRLCNEGKLSHTEGLSAKGKKAFLITDTPEQIKEVVERYAPGHGFNKLTPTTKEMPTNRAVWTVEQVSEYAGVSVNAVQKYVAARNVKKLGLNARSYMLGDREARDIIKHYQKRANRDSTRVSTNGSEGSVPTRIEKRLATLEAKLDAISHGIDRLLEVWA